MASTVQYYIANIFQNACVWIFLMKQVSEFVKAKRINLNTTLSQISWGTDFWYLSSKFLSYPSQTLLIKVCPMKSIDLSNRCLALRKVRVRYLHRAPVVVCCAAVPLLVLDAEGGRSWRTRAVYFHASFSSCQTEEMRKTFTM